MDRSTPGDRLSTCGARMKPIGLTRKRNTGEIMIVHRCLACGKISANRIAGDDNPYIVMSLLHESGDAGGIAMLTIEDKQEVGIVLFGNDYCTCANATQ